MKCKALYNIRRIQLNVVRLTTETEMNKIFTEEILSFFSQKKTDEEISNILQSRYPGERGYFVKSIKRYCKEKGLSPRVSQVHLEQFVATAVQEVCRHYYIYFSYFLIIRHFVRKICFSKIF